MESFRESMLHLIALAFFMAVIAMALAINTIMKALPWIILAAGISVAIVLVARAYARRIETGGRIERLSPPHNDLIIELPRKRPVRRLADRVAGLLVKRNQGG